MSSRIIEVPVGFTLKQVESKNQHVQKYLIEPIDNIKFFNLLIKELRQLTVCLDDLEKNPQLYPDLLELVRTKSIEELYIVYRKQYRNHTTRILFNEVCKTLDLDFRLED